MSSIHFKDLLLILSYVCNAKCSHCYTSCGPDGPKDILPKEVAERVIDELSIEEKVSKNLVIGGGEAGIYEDLLLFVISYGVRRGFRVSIVTNCFKGKTEKEGKKWCKKLAKAGLSSIELSTDSFHSPYIKTEWVGNIIEGAKEAGLEVILRFTVSKKSKVGDLLAELKDYDLSDVKVMSQPAASLGRAKSLGEELYKLEKLPKRNCLDFLSLTVTPSGNVYPCCLGSELTEGLMLGNCLNRSMWNILDDLENNLLVREVLTKGPGSIIEKLDINTGKKLKKSSYLNICELCNRIFENKRNVEKLKEIFAGES